MELIICQFIDSKIGYLKLIRRKYPNRIGAWLKPFNEDLYGCFKTVI